MRADATAAAGATTTFRPASKRSRHGAEAYVAGLKARLSIGPDQIDAWSAFADALSRSRRRTASGSANGEEPFGALADRLAALERIRHAAGELLDVLSPAQQGVAAQVLPLCALPGPAAGA
jgi:hypothetical protein